MRMGIRPGHEKPSLRAQLPVARCVESDDELLDSNTVEIIGSAGNRKKRKNECVDKSKPFVVEGTDEWSWEEARDPPVAATITRGRYQGKSTLPKQKTPKMPHRRSNHKSGIASTRNASTSNKKSYEDAVNIQKTCRANCDGDNLRRPLLKPTTTMLDSPRLPRQASNLGNSEVEDQPNISPRAFCIASGQQNPEKNPSKPTSSSSPFNSWFSWPFKNQVILIDLTSSRENISTNHETLDSDDECCWMYECGERLGLMLPQKKVRRKGRASRRSSQSSHSIHNVSRGGSEIDELLDKLVDGPLTRLADMLDRILDYISISMCHHVLYTIKYSNNKYRLREVSTATNSIPR